ncbi:MAG TPA: ABC transporter substrate-binding protein [Acidimicrobiia bacterium]|nr:ABC transporter substrate-binding protein [Acidimicrobiia bacterium]
MHEKTLRTIGALVVLAALVAVGISQASAGEDTTTPEIVTAEPTPATTGAPLSDSTVPSPFHYRVGMLSGLSTDNFWAFYGEQPSVWNAYVLGPTKPALYSGSSPAGPLQPELAEEMVDPVLDESGWRVRIDLRSDFEWSDGEPITAHDVVFTFEAVRDLELGGSWADAYPAAIESMHAESDTHLRIEFTTRPQLSVWPYGIGAAPIMAEHVWSEIVAEGDVARLYQVPADADVHGGPLAIEHVSTDEVRAVANAGYPIGSTPDVVTYTVFPDDESAVAALAEDTVDIVLSPHGLATVAGLEDVPGVEVVSSPANALRYLGFNLDRDPMATAAFRRAVALLLDRSGLAAAIGVGSPAWSMIPEANERWHDAEAVSSIQERFAGTLVERLESALQELRAAGYSWSEEPTVGEGGVLVAGTGLTIDGVPPQTLTILTPGDTYDPIRLDYVDELTAILAALGFDARAVPTDFDTVVDLAFTPDEGGEHHYDMYVLGWTLGDANLPRHYEALFAEGAPLNNTGYESSRFAAALAAFQGATDHRAAREALWEMEAILADDLPYLPLYTSEIVEAYRSDRVELANGGLLGGWQGRLGGILDVAPVD